MGVFCKLVKGKVLCHGTEGKAKRAISYLHIFLCEFIGMFYFLFIGCSCLHVVRYKSWDFFGGILGFAFINVSCMQFMQFTSGGYMNPALTLAMFFVGYIDLLRTLILILAQFSGSILGFYILKILSIRVFDQTENVWCCTIPSQESILVLVGWEFLTTSLLIATFLVLSITNKKEEAEYPGKAEVNYTFALLSTIYPIAEYSGVSMNPARSLGPALINDCWELHWIYWCGPLSAAVIVSVIWNLFNKRNQESATEPVPEPTEPG